MYPKAVYKRAQNISIINKGNEELVIKGIPDKQIATKPVPNAKSFVILNMSLDLFNN
jgi:hypothetical protein